MIKLHRKTAKRSGRESSSRRPLARALSGIEGTALEPALRRLALAASHGASQLTIAARSVNAVSDFLERASDARELSHVCSANEDAGVLAEELKSAHLITESSGDPLAKAKARGWQMRRDLLNSEGESLTAAQVEKILGVTRQTVDNRRKSRKLIAVSTGRHGYSYPSWQFEEHVFSALEPVLSALPEFVADWAFMTFFLNGNAALGGRRPLDELRKGNVDAVLRAAEVYNTQGA